jgi:hypothetical protein
MSYGYQPPYQPYQQPPKRRGWFFGCLVALTVLVFLVLALVLGALFYLKPRLSQQAGDLLASQLDQQIDRKVQEQFGGAGGEIPTEFSGQVVIPEAEVNDYIRANPQEIAPLDSATVQFLPDQMLATVSAYGLEGTAAAGIAIAADGRVVVVDPHIDGALGYLLDANQLAQSLETQLNNQLAANGQRITSIAVQTGQIVAEIEK